MGSTRMWSPSSESVDWWRGARKLNLLFMGGISERADQRGGQHTGQNLIDQAMPLSEFHGGQVNANHCVCDLPSEGAVILMTLLKSRIQATNEKLEALKLQRKADQKAHRQAAKLTRADRERKKLLVGEAVLARVARGDWDEEDFRLMMDEALSRPMDRALFDLDAESSE
jgi:hypothetical protein